jgi:glycosyltransferase involved in cell wall biosynthesis
MISGDRSLLETGSSAHVRLQLQRSQVDQLEVFVWPQVHTLREICHAARADRVGVVTAQDPFWRGLIAWRVARKSGAELNLQLHADLTGESFFRCALARFTLRRARSIRVVSEKLAEQVRALGVTARVSVLPIYVDVSSFRDIARKPHTQKTILWLGRLESEKDPLRAVQVLQEVRAEGVDAKLVILGSGSLEGAVRQSAEGLPVEMFDWRDPKPYLQVADVVLSTSMHESWGASIVEALASGVPVVAPDVGIARAAGARIADRAALSAAVADVLKQGSRGVLQLNLPSAEEWAKRWRESLL